MKVKNFVSVITGVIGSLCVKYLGGYDMLLDSLLMFMVIDYITGIYVAGVLHKSPKTTSGGLNSSKGYQGLVKKIFVIVLVAIMYRLDLLFNIDYLRNGTIIAFMFQEGISIIENIGIAGVKVPEIVKKGIDLLNKGVDNED